MLRKIKLKWHDFWGTYHKNKIEHHNQKIKKHDSHWIELVTLDDVQERW